MVIYTHQSVDLDAVTAVWAVKQFVTGMSEAEVRFKPANWDGLDAEADSLIVDIDARGIGLKGFKSPDGSVHSATAMVVAKFACQADKEDLELLATFVDIQDVTGRAVLKILEDYVDKNSGKKDWRVVSMLVNNSLTAVFNALKVAHKNNDGLIVERMSDIFSGMLETYRSNRRAKIEADSAEIFGKVALIRNAREVGTNATLFGRGVSVVVYVQGNDLGVVRANGVEVRLDSPPVRQLIKDAGEEIAPNQWFAHSGGFLLCWGSRKSPAMRMSAVNPQLLAKTLNSVLAPSPTE